MKGFEGKDKLPVLNPEQDRKAMKKFKERYDMGGATR